MDGFVIFGLPRSRTAWLSRFLTYGEWTCGHDELRHMRSMADVAAWFDQPNTGTVETGGAAWWRLLPKYGNPKIVVVRRPVVEVVKSLMAIPQVRFDRDVLHRAMTLADRKLDQIEARLPGVLSVDFRDLGHEETCARVFEHCLPYRHDSDWWADMDATKIEINFYAMTRYCQAYAPAMERLASIAKHEILAEMAVREPVAPDGITFQVERFNAWLRDAKDLIKTHLILVNEAPDDWRLKNLALMERLDDIGAMQIMTARSNGRIFGYLMSIISPSLGSDAVTSATNATFYADPSMPGLGVKIQRAALRALQKRGVTEVFMEAGKRASGPRIGSVFRRLGAVPHGEVYRLQMPGVQ